LYKTRYTYLGNSTIEVVVNDEGKEIDVNILPSATPPEPASETTASADTLLEEVQQTPDNEVLAQPLTASAVGRAKPALIRWMYTSLFSFLGFVGTVLATFRDNLSQITEFGWWTLIVAVVASIIAGALYALKKYYKPEGTW
jgi:hypothetical protein